MKRTAFTLMVILILGLLVSCGSQPTYPGATWGKVNRPEAVGFSSDKLAQARAYSDTIFSAAVVIVKGGQIVDEWGEVSTKYKTHSIRKSFLSALYGNYVRAGVIDLEMTLAELGIDDVPPLSEEELQATVRDCIKARSGIYHPALYETEGMRARKPERFSARAGTHWYYNNWDFNVLGTIFERATGLGIFDAIYDEIAAPIQMEDYVPGDGEYVEGEDSQYRAYPFRITARDLARFGLLMLRDGKWEGRQLIPGDWVEESTRYHSDAALYRVDGYGYMWWVARRDNKYSHYPNLDVPEGTYSARGSGGHAMLVIPAYDLVIVQRMDTQSGGKGHRANGRQVGRLLSLILAARTG